ncbi:hypothetical protein DRO21_05830 [archaeon]|nr:MAG: hypothetical protein DRJ59_06555 [Thermoprotei archaeon]RLG63495.1 MAG: hypothetical protein DRO21_05830 [archaeon]
MTEIRSVLVPLAILAMLLTFCTPLVKGDFLVYNSTDYDEKSLKVHVEFTLIGGEKGALASEYPRDLVILMDVSLSMRDVYMGRSRLDWAKDAVISLLESLYAYKTRVGVIAFSDSVVEVCPLTLNFEDVKDRVNNVSCHGFSTNYGDAILKAVDMLKARDKEAFPLLIILTDGGSDEGATNVEDAVDLAKRRGVTIHVVGFGSRDDIDEIMLREKVAKPTGGKYRYASFESLNDALVEVQGMEEILSATNLRITILQSEDATLDYFSVNGMGSPGVVLVQEGHRFVCPKIAPNGRIEVEFDTFTPKTGSVDVATVLVEFVDENGNKRTETFDVKAKVPARSNWMPYAALLAIITVLVALLLPARRKIAKVSERAKNLEGKLSDAKNSLYKLEADVENEFKKHGIVMPRELMKKFDEVRKKLE